jgi:predicted nucleic acid-binding protein
MRSIFVDTGFIIALESVTDQNHEKASRLWNEFLKDLPVMVTTTYVIDEIVTFFNSRSRHAKAVEIGNRLMNSRWFKLFTLIKGCLTRAGSISNSMPTRPIQ